MGARKGERGGSRNRLEKGSRSRRVGRGNAVTSISGHRTSRTRCVRGSRQLFRESAEIHGELERPLALGSIAGSKRSELIDDVTPIRASSDSELSPTP